MRLFDELSRPSCRQMGHVTNTAVSFVLLQIETIKFATDWHARHARPGGKKRIGTFFRTTFMQDRAVAHEFEGLAEPAKAEKLKQLAARFATWRNTARLTVTTRNRLLRLYNTVSASPHRPVMPLTSCAPRRAYAVQFGPGVLLDPTWAADKLVRGRSRIFVPVLDAVSSHPLQADAAVDASNPHALQALVDIMTVLGGDAIGAHVDRFVHTFPPVKPTPGSDVV